MGAPTKGKGKGRKGADGWEDTNYHHQTTETLKVRTVNKLKYIEKLSNEVCQINFVILGRSIAGAERNKDMNERAERIVKSLQDVRDTVENVLKTLK